MQWLWAVLTAAMMTVAGAGAQITGDARASALLTQARTALGGEAALAKITGLACHGTFRRDMGGRDMSGEMELDLALPDKYVQSESMNPMGDATIVIDRGVNGDALIQRSRTIGGGAGMMLRIAGPETDEAKALAVRGAQADLARLALAWLMAPATMPLSVSYAGEADAPDGTKADVLDAKGTGSFDARLFLDQKSHRVLMLTYQGIAPRVVMRTQHGPGGPPEAKPNMPEGGEPPQLVDINVYFDDYRQVDGVWLPHHVSRSIDGKPTEEWTFKTIALNPAFKPDTFEPK
jgi:hypothetical protein